MNFVATKARVLNRGIPPDDFLSALIQFGKTAPDAIFAPNTAFDIYSVIEPVLGPWQGLPHRRAAMLEALRVLAGFESSWNWQEGADPDGVGEDDPAHQESGAFQVSFDSLSLDVWNSLHNCLTMFRVEPNAPAFIAGMKQWHLLAVEYCARLLRISVAWDGPIERGEILPWLSRASVAEFQALIG